MIYPVRGDFGNRGADLLALVSLSAHGPVPGLSVYAATKAAVLSLTESMYTELAPEGIRVHGLCPDGAGADLVAGMTPGGQGSALLHSGGRLLTIDEVAAAAVGLVGSGRVVRTVPACRGAIMRLSRDWPSVAMGSSQRSGARAPGWRAGRDTAPAPDLCSVGDRDIQALADLDLGAV